MNADGITSKQKETHKAQHAAQMAGAQAAGRLGDFCSPPVPGLPSEMVDPLARLAGAPARASSTSRCRQQAAVLSASKAPGEWYRRTAREDRKSAESEGNGRVSRARIGPRTRHSQQASTAAANNALKRTEQLKGQGPRRTNDAIAHRMICSGSECNWRPRPRA